MAATYSSFMTTRFYSPVFNTALFDGPLRIYFSQSYESVALKIYHLLQTQQPDLWQRLKSFSQQSREHAFLMIYPEVKDLEMIFADQKAAVDTICLQEWDEGMAIGMAQPMTENVLVALMAQITEQLEKWASQGFSRETTI